MSGPPFALSTHLAVWQQILGGWLSWPKHRVDAFVDRWREFFDPPSFIDDEASIVLQGAFFHRYPIERVSRLLFSPSLREQHNAKELFLIQREVEEAIYQDDRSAHCSTDYDWQAARTRVEAVLAHYGASLPKPDDLTWYEEEEKRHSSAD